MRSEEMTKKGNGRRTSGAGRHCARLFALVGLCLLLVLAGCGASAGGGESGEAADASPDILENESGTPLADLGGETVYLEEAVFYTRMLQEQWELAYRDDFGDDMWQQEAEGSGKTLEELLKSDVLDMLARFHLLCAHAADYGVGITEEEQATLHSRAENFLTDNTPSVLEAAGATAERVEWYLTRNELASRVSEAITLSYTPEITEEEAQVGKLTYALFSTLGTYDASGNHTPFTEDEKAQIRADAEAFAQRAAELQDIAAAGEELSHTVIDVYFNDTEDGGAHVQVAAAARELAVGQTSEIIETEDGYYVVQKVSDYDADASEENRATLEEEARETYLEELIAAWQEETPLNVDETVWADVRVDSLLTE